MQKFCGSFRPDTMNARNIIRSITAQAFEVYQFFRLKTVLVKKFFLVVNFNFCIFREQNSCRRIYELQRISVARDNFDKKIFCRLSGKSSDNIISLKIFCGNSFQSDNFAKFFIQRNLCAEFVRHFISCALVFGKNFCAKSFSGNIHSNRRKIRIIFTQKFQNNICKTRNRTRRFTCRSSKRRHRIKSSINQAAAVENHETLRQRNSSSVNQSAICFDDCGRTFRPGRLHVLGRCL